MRDVSPRTGAARLVLFVQGCVYVVTGLWPVAHLASFERVTGEKFDDFLVHTVGLLLFVIGITVLWSLRRGRVRAEVARLAAGSATSLGLIDVVYWTRGRLPPVYLLDAVMEFAFLVAAMFLLRAVSTDEADAG